MDSDVQFSQDEAQCDILDDIPVSIRNQALTTFLNNLSHTKRLEQRHEWTKDLVDKSVSDLILEGNRANWVFNRNSGICTLGKDLKDVFLWQNRWFKQNGNTNTVHKDGPSSLHQN